MKYVKFAAFLFLLINAAVSQIKIQAGLDASLLTGRMNQGGYVHDILKIDPSYWDGSTGSFTGSAYIGINTGSVTPFVKFSIGVFSSYVSSSCKLIEPGLKINVFKFNDFYTYIVSGLVFLRLNESSRFNSHGVKIYSAGHELFKIGLGAKRKIFKIEFSRLIPLGKESYGVARFKGDPKSENYTEAKFKLLFLFSISAGIEIEFKIKNSTAP